MMLSVVVVVVGLFAAGLFMNTAWYLHISRMRHLPWFSAAFVSWGIALAEYLIQVPTNRFGARALPTATLKILAEAASLLSFVAVSVLVLREPLDRNYAAAAGLVLVAAWIAVTRPL